MMTAAASRTIDGTDLRQVFTLNLRLREMPFLKPVGEKVSSLSGTLPFVFGIAEIHIKILSQF